LDVEALTKQNGVRLLGKLKKKFKKKVKTDLPYLSFYKKPETHIFFFALVYTHELVITARQLDSHPHLIRVRCTGIAELPGQFLSEGRQWCNFTFLTTCPQGKLDMKISCPE
jgi:hypothetical protein